MTVEICKNLILYFFEIHYILGKRVFTKKVFFGNFSQKFKFVIAAQIRIISGFIFF